MLQSGDRAIRDAVKNVTIPLKCSGLGAGCLERSNRLRPLELARFRRSPSVPRGALGFCPNWNPAGGFPLPKYFVSDILSSCFSRRAINGSCEIKVDCCSVDVLGVLCNACIGLERAHYSRCRGHFRGASSDRQTFIFALLAGLFRERVGHAIRPRIPAIEATCP